MQYTNEYSGSEGQFFRNRTIGGVTMENDALPQYMRIARSIAQRIADGELMEGEKLSGRSKLSSEYNVSPETIRKAVQVLQDRAVVIVREQSGVYVLSAEQARQCLAGFKDGGGLIGKKHRPAEPCFRIPSPPPAASRAAAGLGPGIAGALREHFR